MKIKYFLINNSIFLILIIAVLLRLWRLDVNPPHLSPDEASLGYNAYSILRTGKDEYGKLLPLIFKSFGDYKPGLYVYLTVPFVAVFGLNEWSVRLPSALAGVIAVWLIFKIVKELLESKFGWVNKEINVNLMASVAALLLTLSPWHIHFSRGAWEINVSLTLTLAGLLFFLKSLKNAKYIILSVVLFSLTFLTYQGAKMSTLIVVLVILTVFFREIIAFVKENIKIILLALAIAVGIVSPALLSFSRGQTGRLKVFSIFSYPRPKDYIESMLNQNNEKIGDLNYLLFHGEILNYKRGILGRYFNHFSGRFLFFEGDYQNPKHSSPNHGMLMLFDLLLLPFGIYYLVGQKSRFSKFIFLWLFLSPFPAVLTRDQVQAVRAFNMVIPLSLISAYGLVKILTISNALVDKFRVAGSLVIGILVIIFSGSLIYFLDSYYIHLPIHNAKYWNYGYREVIEKMLPIQKNYRTIYFQQSYNQPYIYYLFYSKYDPSKYQRSANLTNYMGPDVGLVEKLDNISYSGWSWPYATGEKSTLIIGDSVAIPSDFNSKDYNLISEIKYPDNFMTAFRIVETK